MKTLFFLAILLTVGETMARVNSTSTAGPAATPYATPWPTATPRVYDSGPRVGTVGGFVTPAPTAVYTPPPRYTVQAGPVKDGTLNFVTPAPVLTVPPPRFTAVSGDVKGGGDTLHPIDPLPPSVGVCCFTKTVIGAQTQASFARKSSTSGSTTAIDPRIACESRNGNWLANQTVCPTPTPGPTVAPPTGICCYPRSGPATQPGLPSGSLDSSMARQASTGGTSANPQLQCQNSGGTWKPGEVSCREVAVDPLPVDEVGSCCKKSIKSGFSGASSASVIPAANSRMALSKQQICLQDSTMEWLAGVSVCPRIIGGEEELIENGVCCDPEGQIVSSIKNNFMCMRAHNTWRANIHVCRKTFNPGNGVGVGVGVPVLVPTQNAGPSAPAVDPGANEQAPCKNYLVIDQGISLQGCMERKGQFNSYRGQRICCLNDNAN